jgi:hypothetical protein
MAESPAGSAARRRSDRALAGVAVLIQAGLLSWLFLIGLGLDDGQSTGDRSGWLYVASVAQALVILLVGGALLWKRPVVAAALTLLSFFLAAVAEVVHVFDIGMGGSDSVKACTEMELSAVAEFPPPRGTPPLEFQDESGNGCIARFTSTLSGEKLVDHHRLAAGNAGYEVDDYGEVVLEPGEEASQSPGGLFSSMSNETVIAHVSYERAGDEGPARNQLWVVVEVHERRGPR